MSREAFDAATVPAQEDAQNVSGNALPETQQAPQGRTRRHASSAARVAAFRAAHRRMDFTTTPRIDDTVTSLAAQFDTSKNEVLNSLIRFALTNRNWRTLGLYGAKHQAQAEGEQQ